MGNSNGNDNKKDKITQSIEERLKALQQASDSFEDDEYVLDDEGKLKLKSKSAQPLPSAADVEQALQTNDRKKLEEAIQRANSAKVRAKTAEINAAQPKSDQPELDQSETGLQEGLAQPTEQERRPKLMEAIKADLARSGLVIQDIEARPIGTVERTVCAVPMMLDGYAIPYYDMMGNMLDFYRVRLFNSPDIKYMQLKNSQNHTYFPKDFWQVFKDNDFRYIIFTEGEKKAAAAVKAGFPCVAFGGVDSWRNRLYLLPRETQFQPHSYSMELISAKIPANTVLREHQELAVGLGELIETLVAKRTKVVIAYDSDCYFKAQIQRAAATLGFELISRGIRMPDIKQLHIPFGGTVQSPVRMALDDILVSQQFGVDKFREMLEKCLSNPRGFPVYPNIAQYLAKKLQRTKLSRKDMFNLSLAVLGNLDATGIRMYCKDEMQLYYFNSKSNQLMPVHLNTQRPIAETDFGEHLYQNYGLVGGADQRLLQVLGTQFKSEGFVENVVPQRVICCNQGNEPNCIRYQISDTHYVKVTGNLDKPIEIVTNGHEGYLFEAGCVGNINMALLQEEIQKQKDQPLSMWWGDVLKTVRLKAEEDERTTERQRILLALHMYASPWLHRWRGTQLPVELVIGEAGSGKSTLCELRLEILTGSPKLRNAPSDIKDWYASIANSGGLHVTDNIQLRDKQLQQRMSDEICRLITEPSPKIEMRRYYTNADLITVRADAVFCFTAVRQPFENVDILQRAIKIELDRQQEESDRTGFDSSWKENQIMSRGGREAWLAHHLWVLHKFFVLTDKVWNKNYVAKHRLINMEQILIVLGQLFNIDTSWIPNHLTRSMDNTIQDADWVLEGLGQFALEQACNNLANGEMHNGKWNSFSTADISEWAMQNPEYMDCQILTNTRKLGRYMQTHKAMIAQICFLVEEGKRNNKVHYRINTQALMKKRQVDGEWQPITKVH